ncbi:hypothetical protein GCM10022393_10480 [Aquimarina addita]|uniref:peptide-methionine (S)-S-oxide reductase n=1 Tax=Aquimarina addita TaxID=870485 RepID=A0ABP7XD22_9FLAO
MGIYKLGLGGGCHWCTEAVFQSLHGVLTVEQGYISSIDENISFSEAVIIHYEPSIIVLKDLIEIHLYTHQSTTNHKLRKRYRSAVYFFYEDQRQQSKEILQELQRDFDKKILTQVLPFKTFKSSRPELLDYYKTNPERPFCKSYIHPKLLMLREKYSEKLK